MEADERIYWWSAIASDVFSFLERRGALTSEQVENEAAAWAAERQKTGDFGEGWREKAHTDFMDLLGE
jgi:hypothetical protein